MTPYYDQDGITIYHGDCLDVIPTLEAVDLIVTDPPYGISYQSNMRQGRLDPITRDDVVPAEWVRSLRKSCQARTATVIYWFANESSLCETRDILKASGFALNVTLVWDKQGQVLGDLNDYGRQTEYIVYASAPDKPRLNGGRDPNLISVPRVDPRRIVHPAEKPVALLSYLIVRSTAPREVVLDPFMGSGSTLVAAQQLGRRAIGIEIEERYCETAVKRLAQGVLTF